MVPRRTRTRSPRHRVPDRPDAVVAVLTTPARLAAAIAELETAYIGNDRGRLLSAFVDDCESATPTDMTVAPEGDAPRRPRAAGWSA